MIRVLLLAALLAGCASPSGPAIIVAGVALRAAYDDPTTPGAVAEAARAAGWATLEQPRDPGWRVDIEKARVQLFASSAVESGAWTIERSFPLAHAEQRAFDSSEQAEAYAAGLLPRHEVNFTGLLAPIERAGGWSHVAVSARCVCAVA